MEKIVSSARMAAIDYESINTYNIAADLLMEQAGRQLAEQIIILSADRKFRNICVAAGSGHNGGDGLVIARRLSRQFNVSIVFSGNGKSDVWQKNKAACTELSIPSVLYESDQNTAHDFIKNCDCLVDCLTGTGLPGPVRKPAADIISFINANAGFVFSVDTPSGIFDGFTAESPAVKADYTYTIALPKLSFFSPLCRPYCGKLRSVQIGFPERVISDSKCEAYLVCSGDIPDFYKPLKPENYKNSKGHLLVAAGNTGTSGAAWLASTAATHSGCGLVSTVCAPEVYPVLASGLPSVMVRSDDCLTAEELKKYKAFCAGPGWGKTSRQKDILKILLKSGLPGVLDADALHLFPEFSKESFSSGHILTPHPGEFAALYKAVTGKSPDPKKHIINAVNELSKKTGCVIIYKACISIIAGPGSETYIADGMFPPLAVAGAGDVLAGLAGGLLARGFGSLAAAVCAVLIHLAGARKLYKISGLFNAEQLAGFIGREAALYEKK